MDEILKKLDAKDRSTIERTLEMLKNEESRHPCMEHICVGESMGWQTSCWHISA